MKGMSKFQLILTGIFAAFIIIGVLVFSFGQSSQTNTTARATVWGTMPTSLFNSFMDESGLAADRTVHITYVEKRKETFDQEFIEALASGSGPDVFFLPQDTILKHQDKIFPIPFASYPERMFKDTFVEQGELYLVNEGALALPFIVDPMVMYWNRDMFSNASLSVVPKYWSEFYDLATKLTVKDTSLNITKSAFSLGEYANVTNADEIISLLVMQAGNPITVRRPESGEINNLFNQRLDLPVAPAELAVNFYTEFSNPLKPFYSWNRALPDSKSMFLSGDLAIYLGFASELADIRLKNPNLNFDIAAIPQTKSSERNITFGRMVGLAITKNSKNIAGAYQVISKMTSAQSVQALSTITNLPPVRRDLLATRPSEAFKTVFYDGAIQSRAWLSPEPTKLKPIFKEMIESITSGRASLSQVISRAGQQLNTALGR